MSQSNQSQGQDEKQEQQTPLEFTCSPITSMVDSDSFISWSKANPPKDFVCPITSNIFNDPVTLETGQTYEREAIGEWLDRGNSTCPVTRQKLSSTQLPKTNYVLKRLIDSWIEQNPYSTPIQNQSQSPSPLRAPSPTSVISQASIDGTTADLRLAISQLCTSEILDESEMAVLHIEQFWRDSNMESEILAALSKPAVINGFVEILFNSVNPQILRSTVFLLAELASKDKYVIQTLTRVDSDIDCMVALFKKGLVEAIVLIYLLNLSLGNLIGMDMLDALIMTVKRNVEDEFDICLKPKTVSVLLLWRMMRNDARTSAVVAGSLVSGRAIQSVVLSLGAELIEERIAAIGILVRCIEEDGNCRNLIADQAKLAQVMESFTVANDIERLEIVRFLHELVKLSRRTFNQQILQIIKDEGVFSTMHTLLLYLQTALKDQAPIVAALLLQLDLLVEPKLMSVYREEAIDALISSLKDSNFPSTQILAAETISSLQGRFSYSGKPLIRAFLLKHAGMTKSYRALMRAEQLGHVLEDPDENLEEEKAADEWERRMAFALVSHEFGLIFEALADGMKSKNAELFSVCLVSATWLVHMLSFLPDTGLRGAARMCLLKRYISILKSSRNVDDKAFAMLALRSFMNDPEGMNVLTLHIKDIMKTMRELKKSSVIAYEMLKLLSDGQESSTHDFWNHKELNQADCSTNGEVSSIVYFRKMIFSGHSDGTIKIWSGSENILDQIQEAREHTKAVTSLAILQSGDKLYSGSLDKTVRVWCIRDGKICCVEVHDMKDQVHNLTVANTIACFSPQGAGVKVFSWNGGSKLINPNKYVKTLALVNGKLYCGCHDNSIQEIDLASGTLGSIQTGNKKLLAKANPIYALQVNDGLLYSASSTSDGSAVKIHNASNYTLVGSLPCTAEIRSIAISADLIYIGCKIGIVDIWAKEKLTRIASLQTKTNSKVQCMAVDSEGEVLVVGTSDGRIQVNIQHTLKHHRDIQLS
ncbi:putative E3 ubiquitin-protein ligase LIN-1 isoform X1 [Asparagus officinalis]|uniref:putative E3 ubiquitin-protein ligase LIN-1 isoform X1 n=1 Tax=Asparagus officinalis TaxID=4686 RepID=UPI00098E6451|nr:putative E3 ubiquitin-protein ligase LIN-1 isoform X1 [Asparagus officinalis]